MPTSRSMTKSRLALAKEALAVGEEALPLYGSSRSRHDFTLPQLFAIMALRQFSKEDYRGAVQMLEDMPALVQVLHLKKVPHYTTVQKAQERLEKKGFGDLSSTLSLRVRSVGG